MRAAPATRRAHRARLPVLRRGFAAFLALVTVVALGPLAAPDAAAAANYELKVDALGELVEPIRTRTLVGRWIDDPDFDPAQMTLFLERAKAEAEAIARAAGFFSAQAQVSYQPASADRLPVVRIDVDAGARTTVNRFEFVLEGPPQVHKLRERLLESWPLPEGTFFRSAPWQSGKRLLIDALQQRGYVRARIVESEARVDPLNTTAALTVRIDSGPRLDFGSMTIDGLSRYDAAIVYALAPWEGDGRHPYDFDEVLAFQALLRTSGYFDSAEVLPDFAAVLADPKLSTVPMRVELSERRAQRVTLGVGVSSDEGARALLGYEHRNVFDKGWQLESGVLLQRVRRRVFASLRTPQKASGHYYQGGVRIERFDVQGELTDKQTAFIGEGKRSLDTDRFLALQYQTEQRNVRGIGDVQSTRALTLGYTWSTRRLDSTLDPRRGYTINAQVSGASHSVLSDRSFVRLHLRTMRFWPMPDDSFLDGGILIGLAEVGQVFAAGRDGIPSENLFRAGGTSTIRGYDFLSLGVREGRAVVGGRVLALGSLEYQHPVRRDWYAAAFVDAGDAADTWGRYGAVAGYGVGARWRSPVGPVSVDLAYGEAVRDWRLHFSVGYAF